MTAETDLPINDAVPAPTKIEPGNLFLWNWRQMQVYAQACVAHATAAKDAEIEALRAEVERANSWNERVSVCRDHVADIVDGPCVICALDAAESRAERLEEALQEAADDLERGIDARIVVAQLRARADLLRDQEE